MIQLKLRTEFSFRSVYGHMAKAVAACEGDAVGIADTGTWGFVKFAKECKKQNKKPIFGVSIAVTDSLTDKRKHGYNAMTFLAKNVQGLREIYHLTSKANETNNFYYVPRLAYDQIPSSDNLILLSGSSPNVDAIKSLKNLYLEASPSNHLWLRRIKSFGLPCVAVSDVYYPYQSDRLAYEMVIGDSSKTGVQYIADEWMLRAEFNDLCEDSWFENTQTIAGMVERFELPKAENVKYKRRQTIEQWCISGARERGIDLTNKVYSERLARELEMIKRKGFEDYFFVLADMIYNAKKTMLVGVARGSSAGSLACYLMGITDVNPIPHGLIFERFLDITRSDLPDIDVDFPDVKREQVIKYLENKYGRASVGHIGTISEYKPQSVINDVAKSLGIKTWEIQDFKDAIIERAPGDARANLCIRDTFDTMEIGQRTLAKFPALNVAAEIEGHARHTGVHAAGIIVLNEDIRNYCAVTREGTAMIDKTGAEELNILKIDILGLTTLSVIEDCLAQIGMDKAKLLKLDLNDPKVFGTIFNQGHMAGVFQFDGDTLRNLTRQMPIEKFDDIVALTTLARPGPLASGGAGTFIKRRNGTEAVSYEHSMLEAVTKDTFGVIIYQEQIMQICREIGKLSWEDVTSVRKAMGKSLGEEAFHVYWEKFKAGALENGLKEAVAKSIWDTMREFGAYAFNKSHAVSYGIISYWCAWLKTYYPLEYAAACLRHNGDSEQITKMLRELLNEGYKYKAFDPIESEVNWSIKKGVLVGGLIGIKGIGQKQAEDIAERRSKQIPLTPRQQNLLAAPEIAYADVFEVKTKFQHFFDEPEKYKIESREISPIKDINTMGVYILIGKLTEINRMDLNDPTYLAKRGGKIIEKDHLSLNLKFEDDTDSIKAQIGRWDYSLIGQRVFDEGRVGDIYLVKGRIKDMKWRTFTISKIKRVWVKGSGYVPGCEPQK